ncbi:tRNA guanosine(34) transglycosylase Tgt [Candidatus Peregrinibacteria bacterium]|jgi:queuine tRNA-ribosyltransferase|nr:tRNA guanosine(34) transglycosylase Tgt [Candidatus Peregrinibacteria bacterium]MBT4632151.1 tRNA guanosine(34) transglycosylase Tgt [Candidatus Peregrinibacteria bacterium]MBT5517074.1 tRNA guanosine(34) transglycosylase Tgt [Candidatus Peregrinibacteria bacterium]MBT5824069.1 tRNA guanosine(34) transglycosylase Tgt [Candidatus Peregrinibacteria bacterium]
MFDFKILKESSECEARLGEFTTPHGNIKTPVFMPVGTKATVKSLDYKDLENLGAEVILTNTYHMAMRPGSELVKKMGGLHKWMNWDRPILTDSGGFQVFSLGDTVKITDEGVEFQSHINGDKHFITPERAIEIQEELGADIIMAFDECAPAGVDEKHARKAMERTHDWIERCIKAKTREDQTLFPIVQGSSFKNLREESAKFMAALDLPGIAIGGVSVGENFEEKFQAIDYVMPHLPKNKPHYLMGVGTPDDILHAIERGIDMFDCVLATRLARHGAFWDLNGRHDISNTCYNTDPEPLCDWVPHYSSNEFSKSYIHHLFKENELLGFRLLSMHNIAFLFHLIDQIRYHIAEGTFLKFKEDFLKKYQA